MMKVQTLFCKYHYTDWKCTFIEIGDTLHLPWSPMYDFLMNPSTK